MKYSTKTFHSLALLIVAPALIASCSHAARDQRTTRTYETPATASAPAATAPRGTYVAPGSTVAVVPDHPMVRTTGVVDRYDPNTGILIFRDGRVVQLTNQSQIIGSAEAPRRGLEPGETVVVRDVLPVGVTGPVGAGTAATGPVAMNRYSEFQRTGTVRTINRGNETLVLTDGQTVRVSPDTRILMGSDGSSVVFTDLRPGDQVYFVVSDPNSADPQISEVLIFRPVTQ